MKFSESWLREWVDPALDTEALVAQITMAGLEVDAVEPVAGEFNLVVVGEILSVMAHPNADKLRICQVDGSPEGPVQVVCGAPNARQGIKVPFALVGATLPGGMKIRKARIRDIDSSGMLCGKAELGLEEKSEGLWELPTEAPVGLDLAEFADLADRAITLDLTPNRGDCLGIRGLAREVGVLNGTAVNSPAIPEVIPVIDAVIPVVLGAGDKCPRYCGRIIRGIANNRATPLWMQEKLRRSGLRSIDPVVDVTNYVLLELGQPMHAFDLEQLSDRGVAVRTAREGESLQLIDGSEVSLAAGTLLISSGDKPVAMAGIMGGQETAVTAESRDIFLESAFFHPLAIVGEARKYGFHTDSSHRFERGVDPELAVVAMERATRLLLDIVGGRPGPVNCAERRDLLPETVSIRLRRQRLTQQLATDIGADYIEDILTRLGLQILTSDPEGWLLKVPSWRFDLAIEADLVEEVARVHGYNRLPLKTPLAALPVEPETETRIPLSSFSGVLVERGYREAITYSFVDPGVQALLSPEVNSIAVANPISSDLAVMRTNLWPGLVSALIRNQNRQQQRVRLFETGLRFLPGSGAADSITQETLLSGLVCGTRLPEGWAQGETTVDFYDVKGDVEALLNLTADAARCAFEPVSHPALHPGQAARITRRGKELGCLGRLHPAIQRQLDIVRPVFLFEISLEALAESILPKFTEPSRFPAVRKDIAVIVDQGVTVDALFGAIRREAGGYLIDLKAFDVYQGKGIENNRKSLALGLTFQHDSRTLTDTEVLDAIHAVVLCLGKEFGAELRGELK